MSVAEYLESIGYEGVIVFDDYGIETLIGIDSENRAVYDYDKMVKWIMDIGDCDYEDAVDCIEYNTIRSLPYVGDGAPIVVHSV